MRFSMRQSWLGYTWAFVGVASVTALYRLLITGVNATTVALSFLLVVLLIASTYGLGPAIMASMLGVLCFNFFFIHPTGTFTIEDPQNWVALFAFLVTAVIASQLSAAARRRARDAERRREEVWKLYQFSRAIIATPDSETVMSSVARQVLDIFGVEYCAIFVATETGGWDRWTVAAEPQCTFEPSQHIIDGVFHNGKLRLFADNIESLGIPAAHGTGDRGAGGHRMIAYAPLKVGVKPTGVFVLISTTLESETIEAIAGLVALALERARFLQEVSRTEALRQSDELKSALLASVSHDLRTPLTSIRAAVDNLLQKDVAWDKDALHEFHLIIREDVHRLTRVVENLLEMARIESGELRLSKQWEIMPDIINDVLNRCAASTRNHTVNVDVDEGLPLVKVDSRLVAQALTNLVENATKYSPLGSEILLRVRLVDDHLIISVTDQGPGVAPDEQNRIFDKFYRGWQQVERRSAGTGMGLAIARGIVEAHGGRIWVESAVGHGSTFTFAIPVEWKAEAEQVPGDDV
jgi:two-component system sensor histidine kinase KdpD